MPIDRLASRVNVAVDANPLTHPPSRRVCETSAWHKIPHSFFLKQLLPRIRVTPCHTHTPVSTTAKQKAVACHSARECKVASLQLFDGPSRAIFRKEFTSREISVDFSQSFTWTGSST